MFNSFVFMGWYFMEILKDKYTITELSERLNVTTHALRYYEREFGLEIPKDHRGRRYYTAELANIMFKIKQMRDEGLEIKAIRKILESEDIIGEPPPVVINDESRSVVPLYYPSLPENQKSLEDFKKYLQEFTEEINNNIANEFSATKEYIAQEILKSKLEIGACVENSVRKLESKMEKHFQDVDRSISSWREKNKQSAVKRIVNKFFK